LRASSISASLWEVRKDCRQMVVGGGRVIIRIVES
jgi:hypothetical protein